MVNVKKIRVNELITFLQDSNISGWKNIPISMYRAKSYSANPRSEPSDVILYMAFKSDELVGYRTIMPDLIFVGEQKIKVGWLSGNWVLESFRRQGISSLLLNEVLKDWDNKLIYTNYALESKAVYDKSGHFDALKSKTGRRFYIRSCFSTILPPKSAVFAKSKGILRVFDKLLNVFNPFPLLSKKIILSKEIEAEYLIHPDTEIDEMFQILCNGTPTCRTRMELQWILKFPWLVSTPNDDSDSKRYYFSSNPKKFEQQIVKLRRDGNVIGFLMLTLNDEKLSIPYCYYNLSDISLLAKVTISFAIKFKASMITVYDTNLIAAFDKIPLFSLFSRRQYQNYFATKEIVNKLKDNPVLFNDGDGDCAFV